LDQPVEAGLLRKRAQQEENRFEKEAIAFHQRVRDGFLEMAKADGYHTWQYIKANRPIEIIHEGIWNIVRAYINAREGKDKS
jgi:dTMP kinase